VKLAAGHKVPGTVVGTLGEGMRVLHPALAQPGVLVYLSPDGRRAEVASAKGSYLLCHAPDLTEAGEDA
jgi:hypothetical protein